MTIKFICSCGKRLRARDEMAARRSVCPRCGSPVGIPSLKPTHTGVAAAPMTPLERLRHARGRAPSAEPAPTSHVTAAPAPVPPPIDTRLVRLLSTRGKRNPALTGRGLEQHWYQCLLYPLRAWRLCLALAVYATVLTAALALVLPRLSAALSDRAAWPAYFAAGGAISLLLPVCSLLDCVLASAVAGEVYYILVSGRPLLVMLYGGVRWLTCILAGPVLFAAAGYWYWLHCGEPALVDYLILAELGVVAFAHWFFALLTVTGRGWLRGLNPVTVIDLAHGLGWRALVAVLAAGALFLAHGLALVWGVAEAHTAPGVGLPALAGAWLSAIFWGAFFCRWLGVWFHRSRPPAAM